jgi:hypothetical protein
MTAVLISCQGFSRIHCHTNLLHLDPDHTTYTPTYAMATSITTVFTIDDTPLGPTGEPLRRSKRLKDLPNDVELRQEWQTINGIDYERRSLYDTEKKKTFKLYAVKAMNVDLDNLWPGRIVKAVDCYPQTNIKVEPYDTLTAKTRLAGPIEAKFRYST